MLQHYLNDLRSALLELDASGPQGFEGLIAAVLEEISGVPFRLAGSGSQHGIDANAAYDLDGISFECKRYDGAIDRNKVLTKIVDIAINDDGGTDLWILAATTPIREQLAEDVRKAGDQRGIATLILDWSQTGLPGLAVAIALAAGTATAFLRNHLSGDDTAARAADALAAIRRSTGFGEHAKRIRTLIEDPTTGTGIALKANVEWLGTVLSNRRMARQALGQPLAPADTNGPPALFRKELVGEIAKAMTAKPDGGLVVIRGEEGVGKSWAATQAWLSLDRMPLTLILPAEEFEDLNPASDLELFVINRLIRQTGDSPRVAAENRWRRKLKVWRTFGIPTLPRVLLLVDGLNQRPNVPWPRILEKLGAWLDEIGGRLIVSSRTAYFSTTVRNALYSKTMEVVIPPWTPAERDTILMQAGIDGSSLPRTVLEQLQNPRILGIALELFQADEIQNFEELSASRLLFEHLRASERQGFAPEPAYRFARRLQDCGHEVLERLSRKAQNDLKVFDGGLEPVQDGRFFSPIEGDPTRYTLPADGLVLALGLAVLNNLRVAHRNKQDLDEVLQQVIEPVSALDMTADVVMAAATVGCLDCAFSTDISAAVLRGFAELQNPDEDNLSAFAALARHRPEAFLRAARDICLSTQYQHNFYWIEFALQQAKMDEGAWRVIAPEIATWLGYYSLSPDRRMTHHPSRDPTGKVEEERQRSQRNLDSKLSGLHSVEKAVLAEMQRRDDGDLDALTHLAFALIAGKPVSSFAGPIVQWCFAHALNPSIWTSHQEFFHLIRLNHLDWRQAREAMRAAAGPLEKEGVSSVGKWALISLLHATGDANDAAQAEAIRQPLVADRPRFESWRFVEKLCATDPCDPTSPAPDNFEETIEKLLELEVSKLRTGLYSTSDDHFLRAATPALARFAPASAITKYREFVSDVSTRHGLPLRQGLFEVRRHNALVTRDQAVALVTTQHWYPDGALGTQDGWIIAEYRRLLAFPLLSCEEQLEALLSRPDGENILLDLMDVANPVDASTYQDRLDAARNQNDDVALSRLLALGARTSTPISPKTREIIAELVSSPSKEVRKMALTLAALRDDSALCVSVAASNWNAKALADNYDYEAWHGSIALLKAAAAGVISSAGAIERIAPQTYGPAAEHLDHEGLSAVTKRIDASIQQAVSLVLPQLVAEVELPVRQGFEMGFYRVSECRSEPLNTAEDFKRLADSTEAIQERQERLNRAFFQFKDELTHAEARVILEDIGFKAINRIFNECPAYAESWCSLLEALPHRKLGVVHNVGLHVARRLSSGEPERAAHLFRSLMESTPYIHIVHGQARTSLDAISMWAAADGPELDEVRLHRLIHAANDHALASEIVAALVRDKEHVLRAYIEQEIEAPEPRKVASAITVAGFCGQDKFYTVVIDRYLSAAGFLGTAAKAAREAHKRDAWAQRWYIQMRQAGTPEDFWRASMLFLKVVDARVDLWGARSEQDAESFQMFWPSVRASMSNRLKKWQIKREKLLFGQEAPKPALFESLA